MKQGLEDFAPSRLFIYYNQRVLDDSVPHDVGASITDGARVVSTQGAPHENLWPYEISSFAVKPPQNVYNDGLHHLAFQVQQVNQDLTSMKELLADGLPIIIGFTAHQSWESDRVASTGIVPMPGRHEQQLGGHCGLVVGYDDIQCRFIVRNSWGTGWGLQGYCLMPYAYLVDPRLSSEIWTVNRTE